MKLAQPRKILAASIFCILFILAQQPLPIRIQIFSQKTTPLTGSEAAVTETRAKEETLRTVKSVVEKTGLDKRTEPGKNASPANRPDIKISVSPAFRRFVQQVTDGQEDIIRGVYVDGVLALRVVQQPADNAAYVSTELETVTQFRSAEKNGITGLLAHNFLSGKQFYDLIPGQEVRVIYGDGSFRSYEISQSYRFQKLTPSSLQSDFIDLSSGEQVSTSQVFNRFYKGNGHLTLQTCLEARGLSNWGLTFIVATPLEIQ